MIFRKDASTVRAQGDESTRARRCILALFVRWWKPCVDRFLWVGADLQVGAMVVAVVTDWISAMSRHELDHLQRTFRAVDIWNLDIGFQILIKGRDVHEQAVGENRG